MNTAIFELAAWASRYDVSNAQPELLQAMRRCLIDVTGVMLAGAAETTPKALRSYVLKEYGEGPCTIFGYGERTTAAGAAILNGAAAHVLDFDDTCYDGIVHGSAVVWPAVLAAAQREGGTGAEIASAFIAGVEVEYALGRALGDALYFKGWWSTAVLGAIGAAAGVARALRLDAKTTAHAIAIAASQPTGLRGVFGTDAKPYICGRAAQLGLDAALAAHAGISGPTNAFEARYGFTNVINNSALDLSEIRRLVDGEFALVSPGVAFKFFPSCSATQAALEATRELIAEHDLSNEIITRVICEVTPLVEASLLYPIPANPSQAQFSMPFTVGCILAFGDFTLDHLSHETLCNTTLQDAMTKVEMVCNGTMIERSDDLRRYPEAARVTIIVDDGRCFKRFVGAALGMPVNPATNSLIENKFRSCAYRSLPGHEVDRLLAQLQDVHGLASARDL